jgi:hypothetical protein
MLGLAITWVLVFIVFFYVRYRMNQYEDRLNLLTNTIQTMAGGFKMKYASESDEEEEEDEDEDEEEEEEEEKLEDEPKMDVSDDEIVNEVFDISPVTRVSLKSFSPDVSEPENPEVEPVVTEVETKTITEIKEVEMTKTLDDLTVKELKEKVALVNGPKLKTKKELIDFLNTL